MPNNAPFLDFQSDIEITDKSNLPHWHQKGKIQFITFRQADSLPQERINDLKKDIALFKSLNPEPWTTEIKRRYNNLIGQTEERLLNKGFGSNRLKNPEIRRIVHDTLHYKADIDYQLLAYVIMPNHVHLLIKSIGDKTTPQILHSIKRFSAFKINRYLKATGKFWLAESFDRIVRNKEHLKHCVSYITENPRNLPITDYELYVNGPLIGSILSI
ncbi:MAG: transposase [Muribaculaceae bacterium]|nr:transposase [Muribaculaceae bacterium]